MRVNELYNFSVGRSSCAVAKRCVGLCLVWNAFGANASAVDRLIVASAYLMAVDSFIVCGIVYQTLEILKDSSMIIVLWPAITILRT